MAVEPLARYVVDAVVKEGKGLRVVARSVDRSPAWVAKMVRRYQREGYEGLEPRSRAPRSSPAKISEAIEDRIIECHKALADFGTAAGAVTVQHHLTKDLDFCPSVSTIARVLKRRGFVSTEPRRRPKSSYLRFEAELPNETWQGDITHWALANGTDVDILDFIDDYSRLIVAADVRASTKAADVVATFHGAAARFGYPASVLTDNGAVFTGRRHDQRVAFQTTLTTLGIVIKNSRPYHPQTCGKIERFHQTLKDHLVTRPRAETIEELQGQVDTFVRYYNEIRPHRARGRTTPAKAYGAKPKATPGTPIAKRHLRVRTDRIDASGKVTIRYDSKLYRIGIGRPWAGTKVYLYVNDLDIRVVTANGELLRHLTLDTTRIYQPQT